MYPNLEKNQCYITDNHVRYARWRKIIKRRYPNSLPALIFAAASAPGVAQPTTNESPKKQSPSYLYLEHQVKKLESQLEEKDDEGSRRIRAIEQKYNAMKLDYEERIKELENNLKRANEKPRPSTHPHTHAHALEKELAAVREGDRRRISELESEISVLQDALSRVSSLQAHAKNKKRYLLYCTYVMVRLTQVRNVCACVHIRTFS
jgi:protein QN1